MRDACNCPQGLLASPVIAAVDDLHIRNRHVVSSVTKVVVVTVIGGLWIHVVGQGGGVVVSSRAGSNMSDAAS